jgi:cytidine deaminase
VGDSLIEAAREAQSNAYAPYSSFRVGAGLEAVEGAVYTGCNVESAAYGLSICAERAAVAFAVARGARQFRRIVVVSDSEPPASPCGACRQVLAEFGLDLEVHAVGPRSRQTWRLADLLPHAFTRDRLA